MDRKKQPGISFDGIILTREQFWRDYSVPEDVIPQLSVETGWNRKEDKWFMEMSFVLGLFNDDREVLRLEGSFMGFFSVIEQEKNMDMEQFMKNHAPALMFPYIREHIAMVTQKAGVKPVLLPPVNILAMVNSAEESPDYWAREDSDADKDME